MKCCVEYEYLRYIRTYNIKASLVACNVSVSVKRCERSKLFYLIANLWCDDNRLCISVAALYDSVTDSVDFIEAVNNLMLAFTQDVLNLVKRICMSKQFFIVSIFFSVYFYDNIFFSACKF